MHLLTGWQLHWRLLGQLLLIGPICLHLSGSQHLAQKGLQLGVHLRQRLLQRCWLSSLICRAFILMGYLHLQCIKERPENVPCEQPYPPAAVSAGVASLMTTSAAPSSRWATSINEQSRNTVMLTHSWALLF